MQNIPITLEKTLEILNEFKFSRQMNVFFQRSGFIPSFTSDTEILIKRRKANIRSEFYSLVIGNSQYEYVFGRIYMKCRSNFS